MDDDKMKKTGTKKCGKKRTDRDKNASARRMRRSAFWRKYMRLTRAGVLSMRALEIIRQEEDDARFAEVVGAVLRRMEDNASMSAALSERPSDFSISEVELVKTAEKRGAWDEILAELADGLADGSFAVPRSNRRR
jgi:type II secretory pathway component PulF